MAQISKKELERLPLRVHDFLAGVPLQDVKLLLGALDDRLDSGRKLIKGHRHLWLVIF